MLLFCLLAAPPAIAHGIGAEDPNRPIPEYLWLGYKHLLEGWDHLLFITAIVLVAGSAWRAAKLITLFVAGHSLTLMLATTQEWKVSAELVDVVIALSVV
ncbi:MAG TPA: HupE/UreJ family protein, partial [Thermoleophilaceae bacterium]|nr:HupE/UreJ family protein [Thermoleophilaceae bacterium]